MSHDDDWDVKVSTGKKKTQSGKSTKPKLRPMKPPWVPVGIDTIRRLDDHAKLMAVKTEERKELRLTVDPCAGESSSRPMRRITSRLKMGTCRGASTKLPAEASFVTLAKGGAQFSQETAGHRSS